MSSPICGNPRPHRSHMAWYILGVIAQLCPGVPEKNEGVDDPR